MHPAPAAWRQRRPKDAKRAADCAHRPANLGHRGGYPNATQHAARPARTLTQQDRGRHFADIVNEPIRQPMHKKSSDHPRCRHAVPAARAKETAQCGSSFCNGGADTWLPPDLGEKAMPCVGRWRSGAPRLVNELAAEDLDALGQRLEVTGTRATFLGKRSLEMSGWVAEQQGKRTRYARSAPQHAVAAQLAVRGTRAKWPSEGCRYVTFKPVTTTAMPITSVAQYHGAYRLEKQDGNGVDKLPRRLTAGGLRAGGPRGLLARPFVASITNEVKAASDSSSRHMFGTVDC